MTQDGRRFRHVGGKSGAFVLAAVLLVVVVLLLAARAQWWFASARSYTVRLPEAGSFGLRAGSAVELLGTLAGYVEDVRIDADGVMTAAVAVREDFARFVGADSQCLIRKKTLDLAGDAYLQITRGSSGPLPDGAELLPCRADRSLFESVSDLVAELGSELRPTLEQLRPTLQDARAAAQEYAALARELRDPQGKVQRLVQNLDDLATKVRAGQGIAARLLDDPGWAAEVEASLRSLRQALERADATAAQVGAVAQETGARAQALLDRLGDERQGLPAALGDLRALLAELRPIVADLGKAVAALPEIAVTARDEVRGLPGLVQRSQLLLGELEKVALAAQQHWLLRGYVPPSPATGRVGGEGVGDGR